MKKEKKKKKKPPPLWDTEPHKAINYNEWFYRLSQNLYK